MSDVHTCAHCPRNDFKSALAKRMHEIRAHEKNWSTRPGGEKPLPVTGSAK